MNRTQQVVTGAVLTVFALSCFALLVWSVRNDNWPGAVVAMLCASPLPMAGAALLLEGRTLNELFNPKTQSWAFMFGDTIVLPLAAAMCAIGWRYLDGKPLLYGSWWVVLTAAVGAAAGIAFHSLDRSGYTKVGAELAVDSPTKLVHDFVAVPVLFGGLLCVGVPLLVELLRQQQPSPSLIAPTVLAVVLVAIWCSLQFYLDMSLRTLDPKQLHPQWDWQTYRTIPYPEE